MLAIHNKKVIDYLCSKWNIDEQDVIYKLKIDFINKNIAILDAEYHCIGNYNLTSERRIALQNYINSL